MFQRTYGEVVTLCPPGEEDRRSFFSDLLLVQAARAPPRLRNTGTYCTHLEIYTCRMRQLGLISSVSPRGQCWLHVLLSFPALFSTFPFWMQWKVEEQMFFWLVHTWSVFSWTSVSLIHIKIRYPTPTPTPTHPTTVTPNLSAPLALHSSSIRGNCPPGLSNGNGAQRSSTVSSLMQGRGPPLYSPGALQGSLPD